MSTMVSARVPTEVYEQGTQRLAAIGSSMTELINCALSYVVETGDLPETRPARGRREIGREDIALLKAKLAASRLSVELPEDWDYREELARGMAQDHEALG